MVCIKARLYKLIQRDSQYPPCKWHVPTIPQTTAMPTYKLEGKQHDTTKKTSVILGSNEAQDVLKIQTFELTGAFDKNFHLVHARAVSTPAC